MYVLAAVSAWTQARQCSDESHICSNWVWRSSCCGKHSSRGSLTCALSTGQLAVSDNLPVLRLWTGFQRLHAAAIAHIDRCNAMVEYPKDITFVNPFQ